jgi:hypothetical protein
MVKRVIKVNTMKAKVQKIVLDGHGCYLGMEKGCFVIRSESGNVERIPLFENEIGEKRELY